MHIFSPKPGFSGRARHAAAAVTLTLALAGCASVPPPNGSMTMAQNQLQAARDAGAADYAPVDLGFAQDKFQQAQSSMAQRDYADAATLADESRADAELAGAKARLGAARAQIEAKMQENTQLRRQADQAAVAADHEQQSAPMTAPSAAEPTQDMPAPASSELSAPADDGFQTIPNQTPPSSAQPQGGQP